jgi:hypothetical protein
MLYRLAAQLQTAERRRRIVVVVVVVRELVVFTMEAGWASK